MHKKLDAVVVTDRPAHLIFFLFLV